MVRSRICRPKRAGWPRRLAEGWLKDRKGVDAEMLPAVLSGAAREGGQELHTSMLQALRTTKDLHEREALIGALGSFRNPKVLEQSLRLLFDLDLDIREAASLFFVPLGDPLTDHVPYEFLKSN
jgi:hypothetical protein